LKFGSPKLLEISGPLQASTGIALPLIVVVAVAVVVVVVVV
jgi:hypothetical protein